MHDINLTSVQMIMYIFSFILIILSIYFFSIKNTIGGTVSLIGTFFLILISSVNPNTLLNLTWSQNANGQELSFERKVASKKETKKAITVLNRIANLNIRDLHNKEIYEKAKDKAIEYKTNIDFLFTGLYYRENRKYEEALKNLYISQYYTKDNKVLSYIKASLSLVYSELNKAKIANKLLEESFTLYDKNPFSYLLKCISLINEGKYVEAKELVNKSIKIDNKYQKGFIVLGRIYILEKKYDEAIKILNEALNIKNTMEVKKILGKAYYLKARKMENKSTYRAGKLYEESIRIYPQDADVYFYFALLISDYRPADALYFYRKAIKIDKENSKSSSFNLAGLLYETGDYKESEKIFKTFLNDDKFKLDAYFMLGLVYNKKFETKNAIETFEKLIKLDIKYKDAYSELGDIYALEAVLSKTKKSQRNKLLKKAEEYYNEVISIDAKYINAYQGLIHLYKKRKDFEKENKTKVKKYDLKIRGLESLLKDLKKDLK